MSLFSLIVVTPVVAFYLIYDWHRMIRTVDGWIPLQQRATEAVGEARLPLHEDARQLHQMSGVVGSGHPAIEHPVVAGPLALFAQLTGGDPHQRMKPVEAAGRLRYHLGQEIEARDVHHFVQQHGV